MTISKCCCFELKTGALIVGWLGIISAVFGFIDGVYGLSSGTIDEYLNELNITDDATREIYKKYIIGAIDTSLAVEIIQVIVNICLLYGTYKRKRLFFLPWLIENTLEGIVTVAFVIILIVAAVKIQHTELLAMLVLIIPSLAFSIYIWICIYNLYKQIRDEELSVNNQEDEDRLIA